MAEVMTASVAGTYKRMLMLAKRLPAAEQASAIQQIRTGFREGRTERNAERVKELLATAHGKISYLKMVTPRAGTRDQPSSGKKRYMMIDGKLTEVTDEGHGASRALGPAAAGLGSIDPDHVRRHNANLRRFHFMDRPSSPRSPLS